MMLLAWHIGPVPPPHSSVQMLFLPSLLKPAVCRPWKLLVSVRVDSRTGFSGFEMSTRMPWLEQAAASRCIAGYAVTSWQLRGPGYIDAAAGASAPAAGARGARRVSAGAQNVRHAGDPSRPVKMRAPGMTTA